MKPTFTLIGSTLSIVCKNKNIKVLDDLFFLLVIDSSENICMRYSLENALELAGYITARKDLTLESLHWTLFHAQAIHLILKGKRLFGEGVLINDSGVVVPSVESRALIDGGIARVRYKGTLSDEHKNILAMSMLYSETPSVVTLCTVGVVENYLRKTG